MTLWDDSVGPTIMVGQKFLMVYFLQRTPHCDVEHIVPHVVRLACRGPVQRAAKVHR